MLELKIARLDQCAERDLPHCLKRDDMIYFILLAFREEVAPATAGHSLNTAEGIWLV